MNVPVWTYSRGMWLMPDGSGFLCCVTSRAVSYWVACYGGAKGRGIVGVVVERGVCNNEGRRWLAERDLVLVKG